MKTTISTPDLATLIHLICRIEVVYVLDLKALVKTIDTTVGHTARNYTFHRWTITRGFAHWQAEQ